MIPEKMFQQVLALGEAWRVVRMDYLEKDQKVLIRVEDTPALWAQEHCPHCQGKSVGGYDHAPERHWRHLNICQLQSEIVCAPPRGQCKTCQKIYTVRVPCRRAARVRRRRRRRRLGRRVWNQGETGDGPFPPRGEN